MVGRLGIRRDLRTLCGEDRGELLQRGRHLQAALEPSYRLDQIQDAFVYAGGRDLSGYEDGTE
ncbi:MAG TPA: hypothetical protein VG963_29470, partial [Polyangiaceae bacterium]|nr:hypothetical protein [Polyangiaceae bacterium]